MDKIEFRYRKFSYGMDDYAIPAVEIFINGRDFMVCMNKRYFQINRSKS